MLALFDALANDHLFDEFLQLGVCIDVFAFVAFFAHNRSNAIKAARQSRLFSHFLFDVGYRTED